MATQPTQQESSYFDKPGLSYSAMKDLAISPLRFWHLHLSPNRPMETPTEAMEFGSALHCRVLEPDQFPLRYARALSSEGLLKTASDLKAWLKERCIKFKLSGSKEELTDTVLSADPGAPVFEVLYDRHREANKGKIILDGDEFDRVEAAATALLNEPRLQDILSSGNPEVAYFAKDPDTGVLLKCKVDWGKEKSNADLKTFSQKRDKTIDRTILDAIYYEGYHLQSQFYSWVRCLSEGEKGKQFPMTLCFVESEQPHETRLRVVRPKNALLWGVAGLENRRLINLYAECLDRFGVDKPWRYACEATDIADDEIPQLMYSRS